MSQIHPPILYWHFADSLTIHQAILLYFNIDPSAWDDRPAGYNAMHQAITSAVDAEKIAYNKHANTIEVASFRAWLVEKKALKPGSFFDSNAPDLSQPSPTVIRWISIRDQLPKKNEYFLSIDDERGYSSVDIARLPDEPFSSIDELLMMDWPTPGDFASVTHWAPLPDEQIGIKMYWGQTLDETNDVLRRWLFEQNSQQ